MDENIKNSKKILRLLIERTQYVNFNRSNPIQAATVSFYRKMLTSAKSVLHLHKDHYNGCILASHMLEGLILLTWMLNEPQKRVRQYANFGIIERLEGLRVYPEEKDDLLKFIKENNLQKLLKKDIQEQEITNDILLNPENYYNKWYRPEVKDINDMVKNLTNGGKHQAIANTKHLYNRLCAYKHYSPFVMLPRYGGKITRMETTDEFLAISAALQSLYLAFLYVNQYQINKIDITDITEKYQKLLNILNFQYSVGN